MIQEDMRGHDSKQASMLCLISPESVVPADHPLRAMKKLVDVVVRELSSVFDAMYSSTGRPSIPPERLLKATVLMALYTVRSERMFCEQLGYNLLFKWFLDPQGALAVWTCTSPRSTPPASRRTASDSSSTTSPFAHTSTAGAAATEGVPHGSDAAGVARALR